MPTVLLEVKGVDTASAVLKRINDELGRSLAPIQQLAAGNDKVALAVNTLSLATQQYVTAQTAENDLITRGTASQLQLARAADATASAKLRMAQAGQQVVDSLNREVAANDRAAQAARDAADKKFQAWSRSNDQQVASERRAAQQIQQAQIQQLAWQDQLAIRKTGWAAQDTDVNKLIADTNTLIATTEKVQKAGIFQDITVPGPGRGASDKIMNFLENFGLYGIGYGVGYKVMGAAQQSIQNNIALSQQAGQAAAQTWMPGPGAPPPTFYTNQIETYARRTAGSGQWQYNAQQVINALYPFISQGLPFAQATQLNQYALGLSQIGGITDPSTASAALLGLMNSGMVRGPGAGRTAANFLQVGANLGAYSLPQLAASLPRAGLAGLGNAGMDPATLMAMVISGSLTSTPPRQIMQDIRAFGNDINRVPTQQQAAEAARLRVPIGPGAMAQAGGAAGWLSMVRQHMALGGLSRPQQQAAMQLLLGQQNAAQIMADIFAGQGRTSFGNILASVRQSGTGQGAYATALGIETKTPGQQLVDAETQLKNAFDDVTKNFVPPLTTAMQAAASALQNFANALPKSGPRLPAGAPGGLPPLPGAGPQGPMSTWNIPDLLHNWFGWGGSTSGGGGAAPMTMAGAIAAGNTQWVMAHGGTLGQVDAAAAQSSIHKAIARHDPVAVMKLGGTLDQLDQAATTPGAARTGQVAPPVSPETAGAGLVHGIFSGLGNAALGAAIASSVAQTAGMTGRSALETPEMKRWRLNLDTAIKEREPAGIVASALGLYKKAVRDDRTLNPDIAANDIATEEKKANAYFKALGAFARPSAIMPFAQLNPGLGGLEAGFQNTAVRFGGGLDPQQQLIRKLEQQLAAANRQIALLEAIVHNTAHPALPTAHTSPVAAHGTNRAIAR